MDNDSALIGCGVFRVPVLVNVAYKGSSLFGCVFKVAYKVSPFIIVWI